MMKKRLLSLLLAGLMGLSLAACQNDVVDDGENSDQQQEIQDNEQDGDEVSDGEGDEDVSGVDSDEVVNTVELNVHLQAKSERDAAETAEKVLKLTVSSSEEERTKLIIAKFDEQKVASAATLEYDVLLEDPAVGMGVFDVKCDKLFLSMTDGMVDAANIGLDYKTSDISNYAYGRWYHRVFELPEGTESVSTMMLRFGAGDLTAGCEYVCYYDNLCLKDANGNVIFEFDEEAIAGTVIPDGRGVSVKFEYVDDPKPDVTRISAEDFAVKSDFSGVASAAERIDLSFSIDSEYSAPAVYIGTPDDSCFLGVRGYVVALNDGNLVLYRSAEGLSVMASSVVVGVVPGKELAIRVETDGNIIRGYFLDDMDGVEPWPEFELAVDEDLTGKTFGVMDVFGRGCTLNTVSYSEYVPEKSETVYTNPVVHDLADPDVLYYDGSYYMYCTAAGYAVLKSTDLINWENVGSCVSTDFTWSDEKLGWYWAPDVEYYNGKFYMVASIDACLGIAVSDSPTGPFIPESEYLFKDAIDGQLFIDDDGQAYIYFAYNGQGGDIYGVKFDMETLKADYDTLTNVVPFSDKWESYNSDDEVYGASTTEGPYLLKHNGLYYMTYSGSDYRTPRYAVGYAVSDSPLGVFEKYEGNPIHIGNIDVRGTAHHCFTYTPDGELLIVYHQHKSSTEVDARKISVDKARFAPTESGIDRIETYGPTTTPQEMPLD